MKPKWKLVHKKDNGSIFARCADFKKYYYPNTVVKEVPGSLGIMVFKTKADAETFMFHAGKGTVGKIIKVLPIGDAKRLETVCHTAGNGRVMEKFYKLLNFYKAYKGKRDSVSQVQSEYYADEVFKCSSDIPDGTQSYSSVRVL